MALFEDPEILELELEAEAYCNNQGINHEKNP